MSQILENIVEVLPVYRVLDREKNLNFFRDVLGMKVLLEEGAMVRLGGQRVKEARILLEESPEQRPVIGKKKHARTVIKADEKEIRVLLEKNLARISKVYQGPKGVAFEAYSPEQDLFLLTADEIEDLVEIDKEKVKEKNEENFQGLSDFQLVQLELNVKQGNLPEFFSCLFNQESFEEVQGVTFIEKKGVGTDLQAAMDETLDIELLIFRVKKEFDLAEFAGGLSEKVTSYLDQSSRVLSLEAPNRMEIWLMK